MTLVAGKHVNSSNAGDLLVDKSGCYKVIEIILIEFHFDYFDINPIEIFTSITILLIRIELKYLVNFDANNVDLNRNEILFFQISWEGENE